MLTSPVLDLRAEARAAVSTGGMGFWVLLWCMLTAPCTSGSLSAARVGIVL